MDFSRVCVDDGRWLHALACVLPRCHRAGDEKDWRTSGPQRDRPDAVRQLRGKSDPGFLAKLPGVNGIAEANCGENCSFATEGLFMFAQLRDVLAAKDSAVVTQENHDGGLLIPQGAKPRLAAVAIGKRDERELMAEGSFHATLILCSAHGTVKRSVSKLRVSAPDPLISFLPRPIGPRV